MAVLAAEMVGLRNGLGMIIMLGREMYNPNLILIGICLVGITGKSSGAAGRTSLSIPWFGACAGTGVSDSNRPGTATCAVTDFGACVEARPKKKLVTPLPGASPAQTG